MKLSHPGEILIKIGLGAYYKIDLLFITVNILKSAWYACQFF